MCGGSKLRSLTITDEMTLRKGEFWSCAQCTLKNPISSPVCMACKTNKNVLDVPKPAGKLIIKRNIKELMIKIFILNFVKRWGVT